MRWLEQLPSRGCTMLSILLLPKSLAYWSLQQVVNSWLKSCCRNKWDPKGILVTGPPGHELCSRLGQRVGKQCRSCRADGECSRVMLYQSYWNMAEERGLGRSVLRDCKVPM